MQEIPAYAVPTPSLEKLEASLEDCLEDNWRQCLDGRELLPLELSDTEERKAKIICKVGLIACKSLLIH